MRVRVVLMLFMLVVAKVGAQDDHGEPQDDHKHEQHHNHELQQHDQHGHEHHSATPSAAHEAFIVITINPEARVSAARGGELPPPKTCGSALELPVKIVNQGFVTAVLEARLVESAPEGASIEFSAEPLNGAREEHRVLRLTLSRTGPWDLTIAFRAKNDIPDLGGRDRIHFLARCL